MDRTDNAHITININVIMGDVVHSAVVQDGDENTIKLDGRNISHEALDKLLRAALGPLAGNT